MNDEILKRDSPVVKELMQSLNEIERNNEELAGRIVNTISGEVYLASEQMCDLLKITHRTLQNYRLKRVVPYTNIGGKYFYPESELIKIFERNKVVEIDHQS
jgi:hypothetical protein